MCIIVHIIQFKYSVRDIFFLNSSIKVNKALYSLKKQLDFGNAVMFWRLFTYRQGQWLSPSPVKNHRTQLLELPLLSWVIKLYRKSSVWSNKQKVLKGAISLFSDCYLFSGNCVASEVWPIFFRTHGRLHHFSVLGFWGKARLSDFQEYTPMHTCTW